MASWLGGLNNPFTSLKSTPCFDNENKMTIMGGENDAGIVSVILGLLHNGYARFNPKNDAMVGAFRRGFIHTEALENGEIICILPTLLHAQ